MSIGFVTLEGGWLWPAADRDCRAVVFKMATDLQEAYAHVRQFGVAVQAGGNCGVWPHHLAKAFQRVYTFEPDPANFAALAYNTRCNPNVVRFQAALGDRGGLVSVAGDPKNCGAYQVTDTIPLVPRLRIDDLGLDACDLLYLDIEGYECPALLGARDTIRMFRPVIALEDKGLSEKYGYRKGEAENWLMGLNVGYRVVARPHRDVILAAE